MAVIIKAVKTVYCVVAAIFAWLESVFGVLALFHRSLA